MSQCGERLPFATKCFFVVGGSAILYPTPEGIPLRITASAILSTGDYRAFRSRVKDTWSIAPGKLGSKRQENSSREARQTARNYH
ncbi:hypothetical protein [Desulfosporosinus sp.]|uniref:hypothetical protein n=1 Tax=Desulfosporosinus sp. TaxID=157907 RepID=UPI0025C427FD|nr:hypothetical protein [Desulfosporosinus sp.]MBC2723447.1 hypothetical protein [Desulfosporosinus sp.]MBC2727783.1 hypothetical protein [Desulfosporosinus sp.]